MFTAIGQNKLWVLYNQLYKARETTKHTQLNSCYGPGAMGTLLLRTFYLVPWRNQTDTQISA